MIRLPNNAFTAHFQHQQQLGDQPHTCYTAAGCLIHDNKVLLVKHKKLGVWLNPGGHIELNELPHQAAEREFYEETGVLVEAIWTNLADGRPDTLNDDPDMTNPAANRRDYFTPNPIVTNLHWVSEQNYISRMQWQTQQSSSSNTKNEQIKTSKLPQNQYAKEEKWQAGCEQHLNFLYLLRPLGTIEPKLNEAETDGLEWFTATEVAAMELHTQTFENIKQEVAIAFRTAQAAYANHP